MVELARAWVALMRPVEDQVLLLAEQFARRAEEGQTITAGALTRLERYQSILAQAEVYTGAFNDRASRQITSGQREIAAMAASDVTESLSFTSIRGVFDRLPVEQVDAMIGMAGNGQPLGNLLERNFGRIGPKFGAKLVEGTALGWNPRRTAVESYKTLQIPLQQAMVTTRTEQLRVYRETTRQTYQATDLVTGMMRLSARDLRVCPACLMADGQILPLGKPLAEHPQGRCTVIPIVDGDPIPDHQKGREWFLTLREEDQREILGHGHYEAWRGAKFDLPQIVGVKASEEWGESLYTRPLYDLTNAA